MSINLFFISNNHKDYCEEKELHLEFKNIFKNEIKYESNLARALELSNKLIKANEDYNRIQEFTENKHIDSNETYCLANCEGPDFTLDYFPLDEIRELKSNKYIIKGKQQSLFQNELLDLYINRINLINSVTVNIGFCPFCSTMHIECECDEIFCENDFEENIYTCRCGNIYCMEGDTLILRNVA
jgi:hypothetical protein